MYEEEPFLVMEEKAMNDIFEMQRNLNEYIFSKQEICATEPWREDPSDETKLEWIERIRMALSAELSEFALAIFNKDRSNAKEELIDMLHFLVSLSRVVDLDSTFPETCINSPMKSHDVKDTMLMMMLQIDALRDCQHWKWWRKNIDEEKCNTEYAEAVVQSMWPIFGTLCWFMGVDMDKLKKIYEIKNYENVRRQDNGY
jgi:dimeric dUTPase (all-alpha-NTP-PPase superfamily)